MRGLARRRTGSALAFVFMLADIYRGRCWAAQHFICRMAQIAFAVIRKRNFPGKVRTLAGFQNVRYVRLVEPDRADRAAFVRDRGLHDAHVLAPALACVYFFNDALHCGLLARRKIGDRIYF